MISPVNPNYFYRDKLQSDRLVTRYLTRHDFEAWSEFLNDPLATALFPASFFPPDQNPAEIWIERQLTRYQEKLYGVQAILNKSTGDFLGQAGLILQEVDGIKELEVGYHMLRKYWGMGYAPEAARLFIDFAFSNQQSDSVISIIDVRNIKSQRVSEKNGLKIDKQTVWRDLDVYIYRISKNDWQ